MLSGLAIITFILGIFFAINMGCSGTAPSFASAYGSKILSHKKVALLFTVFVLIGAYTLGHRVLKTISKGIIPQESITIEVCLIILLAACIALLIANILKVPQSTSQVTVLAVAGIGIYLGNMKFDVLLIMLPMWLILPIIALISGLLLSRYVYKKAHLAFKKRERLLKLFTIATCCYVAFGIGSNNVANAVGPLVGANIINNRLGVLILAPCFGIGSLLIGERVLKTVGKGVTELNLTRASFVCLITGTLLLVASLAGIPQSLVQLNTMAIIGIGLGNGGKKGVRIKTIWTVIKVWVIAPIFALVISFLLISIVMHT